MNILNNNNIKNNKIHHHHNTNNNGICVDKLNIHGVDHKHHS